MDRVATYALVIAFGIAAYALIMMFVMYRRTRESAEVWQKDLDRVSEGLSLCTDTAKIMATDWSKTATAYKILAESMDTAREGRALGDHIKLAEAEVLAYKSWETLPTSIKVKMPDSLRNWAKQFEEMTHEDIKEAALDYLD